MRRGRGRALLYLLAGAAAAGSTASPEPGRAIDRLVIGVRGDVTSFNIYTATNAFSQEIADLLYLKLAAEQDDFSQGPPTFRPALAASWEFSPDRSRLTFHLDPRARWSDGRPVTAEDVILSHRAASSPEVAWVGRDVKEFITEVAAPDRSTVVLRFSRVYPYQLMDAAEGNVLPARLHAGVPLSAWPSRAFLEAPLASGPFLLKRYERGSLIELERNRRYHRAPLPGLGSVIFRIIPDEETLLNELVTGGIDVMENVPLRAARRVEASPRLRVTRTPDLSYVFICWNLSRPFFADPRVRRALAMAMDREAMLQALLPGAGRLSAGPVLSSLWAHDASLRPLPYDPDAAKRLLEEAGWRDGDGDGILDRDGTPFRFELESNQGSGLRADIVQMASAQLKRVGIEAVPRTLETGAFIERHEKHDFDAFVGSWRESTKVDLRSVFHGDAREGGYNYGLYQNAELDRTIDQARVETDTGAARLLWARAQQLIAADQPYTFLLERDRFDAYPRRLRGVRPSARTPYAGLEEWSWEPEDRAAP